MNPQEIDTKHIRWDAYRRFHQVHHHRMKGIKVTQFTETGEYIVSSDTEVIPAARTPYRWLGFDVWRVTDPSLYRRFDLHTPDGTRLKASWLEAGRAGQLLLCDTTCDRAVLLHHPRQLWGTHALARTHRPAWTAGMNCVYYKTAHDVPQPFGPILYEQPRSLTLPEKRHVRALLEAARAWKHLTADEVSYAGESQLTLRGDTPLAEAWTEETLVGSLASCNRVFVRRAGMLPSELLGRTWGELTYQEMATLAYRGIAPEAVEHRVEYLTLTKLSA